MRSIVVLTLLGVAVLAAPLHAQRIAERPATVSFHDAGRVEGVRFTARDVVTADGSISGVGVPAIMGFGYGVAGALVGTRIAAGASCDEVHDGVYRECILSGDRVGAVLGGTALVALGAHMGNRFRGSLSADLAVSAAIGGAGMLLARQTDNANVMLVASAVQLIAVPLTERLTSPRAPPRFTEPVPALPEWRIDDATTPTYATLYGLGGGLAGGFVGFVGGAYVGYRYAYPRDIARGCEDCGLGGTIVGALVGGVSGFIGGALLGSHYGSRVDRESAIERILRAR